ncbi:MAG: hypothetical protein HYX75_05980 [Acidobacteria bacterium]|nr:hypothetical protein [Acidobacteriota bacterium]
MALEEALDFHSGESARTDFVVMDAARAIALRRRLEYFDRLVAKLEKTPDGFISNRLLSSLSLLAQTGGGPLKDRFAQILRPHFAATRCDIDELLWCAWAADLRSLLPDVQRIATSSPVDIGGSGGSVSGGRPPPVTSRYHLARKLASIWPEEDPLTRAKLLLAFGFQECQVLVGAREVEGWRQMEMSLCALSATMTSLQITQLLQFTAFCETELIAADAEKLLPEQRSARQATRSAFRRMVDALLQNSGGVRHPGGQPPNRGPARNQGLMVLSDSMSRVLIL